MQYKMVSPKPYTLQQQQQQQMTQIQFYAISLIRSQTERIYGDLFCFKMRFKTCGSLKVQLTIWIFLFFYDLQAQLDKRFPKTNYFPFSYKASQSLSISTASIQVYFYIAIFPKSIEPLYITSETP